MSVRAYMSSVGAMSITHRPRTRCAKSSASRCATRPPRSCPHRKNCATPSASSTATTSAAIARAVLAVVGQLGHAGLEGRVAVAAQVGHHDEETVGQRLRRTCSHASAETRASSTSTGPAGLPPTRATAVESGRSKLRRVKRTSRCGGVSWLCVGGCAVEENGFAVLQRLRRGRAQKIVHRPDARAGADFPVYRQPHGQAGHGQFGQQELHTRPERPPGSGP